jgi:shikimate dehydrogenase
MQSITQIKPSTQVCAVIGNPVAHSMSPAIHNRAFAELGLDYVYVAFRVEDVRAAVAGMRALENFRGLSVTIPHKVSIIRYLDEVTEVDRGIGSVNTVVNDGGRLTGFGSDGPGALQALLDAGVRVAGRTSRSWSGGAARAIAFRRREGKPASLFLLGVVQTELKAPTRIAQDRNAGAGALSSWALAAVWPTPTFSFTARRRRPQTNRRGRCCTETWRVDIVYNPLETNAGGCEVARAQTVAGAEMFVNRR